MAADLVMLLYWDKMQAHTTWMQASTVTSTVVKVQGYGMVIIAAHVGKQVAVCGLSQQLMYGG
jgi:hypothetical protein